MVEGARLESVYAGDRIAGSNPVLSAINSVQMGRYFVLGMLSSLDICIVCRDRRRRERTIKKTTPMIIAIIPPPASRSAYCWSIPLSDCVAAKMTLLRSGSLICAVAAWDTAEPIRSVVAASIHAAPMVIIPAKRCLKRSQRLISTMTAVATSVKA